MIRSEKEFFEVRLEYLLSGTVGTTTQERVLLVDDTKLNQTYFDAKPHGDFSRLSIIRIN